MITRLVQAGISFDPGMSETELNQAEAVFRFRFPEEIREFLACGVPVGSSFFDYRDVSEKNIKAFCDFQASIERSFQFDLENNRGDMLELLGHRLGFSVDSPEFDKAVLQYFHNSTNLIPFYAHCCFFDGMDHMPIISFWQPVDAIIYGCNFEEYLAHEFLNETCMTESVQTCIVNTGIWKELTCEGC